MPTSTDSTRPAVVEGSTRIMVESLSFFYGRAQVLRDVSIGFADRHVTALIGPSGCGKSTLLRTFNRMFDLVPGARATGRVVIGDMDVLATRHLRELRRRVGLVFQRPSPFPMSVRENVALGPRLLGWNRTQVNEAVERSLRDAALWDDVKDRLDMPASSLSEGQRQQLSIARCIAVAPEVLLMDEPCASLDAAQAGRIEDMVRGLARNYTVVIATHNLQQAARVADTTAFMLTNPELGCGELIEVGPTTELLQKPRDPRTEDYITGRFG